ncbi:Rne/Rng family ribonuclease [Bifidobacterium sp. SMB2]|uniref:Rne/Rng family ribonuclease n=1 Tax=Bifidobacterium saimiriisciurei TaxID=2661627 RepID=A0ABX0C7G4_9BIFI|nr:MULTISPECIES: Rne/Rng family ribonuclease [Bifidobacterium]NEG96285.1 Rne/Rng family ribonuclease [Bifidobacterium sp. SMB2]NEH11083.1 Rne/Rng family ribonuclease [Bifidobacterium saimiriisciurei]
MPNGAEAQAVVSAESAGTAAPAAPSSSSSVVSSPAPSTRRRRGGRRVVRVAGAAGAKLPVKVESAPVAESNVDANASKPADEPSQTTADKTGAKAASENDARPAAGNVERREPKHAARHAKPAAAAKHDADADDDNANGDASRRKRIKALADELFTDKGIRFERPARPSRAHDDETNDDRGDARNTRSARDDRDEARESVKAAIRGLAKSAHGRRPGDVPLEFSSPEAEESKPAGRVRPMTSLLFQEPVLPVARPVPAAPVHDDESDDDDHPSEGMSRRRRRRRGGDRDHARIDDAEQSLRSDDRDSHDDKHADRDADRSGRDVESRGRADADREGDGEHDESRRSRRSRRLNAQERRAAAEVEQIEQDLEYDDIHYSPIDTDADDNESAGETRSRRRRRRGHDDDAETPRSRRERERERDRDREEDEDDGTVTRRRRRRRGSKGETEQQEPQIRRSRKQQYIDEITDIEGSTRLEAKKQRRRDNRRDRSRQSTLLEQDFLARRENVNRLMVVREKEKHTQISVIEDSILVEHYVSDIQEVSTVGNIYLGRVQNVLPSMEAAFVDIGQPRNGVLYAGEVNWDTTRLEGQPRRIELAFRSGDPVLVQVTKDPIGHKGARLTSQVTLAGRFLVLVPSGGMTGVSRKLPERERTRLKGIVSKIAPSEMGVIIRTAAEGASKEAIEKDLENLTKQWEHVKEAETKARNSKRPKLLQGEPDVAIRVVRDIFNDDFNKLVVEGDKVYERISDYLESMAPDLRDKLEKWNPEEHGGADVFDQWRIDSQLRKGMERKVYLPSGGSLVIDRTEAMTTIDVNTGRFIGKGKSLEETVTRCNLEASEEIARQLRLRDIGGMVMIDYVDMVMPQNRDLVLRRLVECLARDRTKHQVAEVTSLGLVQMTRKRVGQGLVEAFSEECPTCKGRGFILHDKPTVSASYDDPYALKGGDPFIKTNKHNHGTAAPAAPKEDPALPKGSTPDVKAKLAKIAAAAQRGAEEERG